MDLYCVFGNPVAHSLSPTIHARFAALTGQSLHYQRQWVAPDGWQAALAEFVAAGGRGANVTVPFKQQAFASAHAYSPRAQRAQACNTLRLDGGQVWADNTDGIGLVNDLRLNALCAPDAKDLLIIGAGGAAAGILGPLIEARPRRIVVANRSPARADALVQGHASLALQHRVALSVGSLHAPGGSFDIVINASSSSLEGAAVPVPTSVLGAGALAYDLMYGPKALAFMRWAQAQGAQARDGLGMLVEQAAEAFTLWRGVRPPAAQVLAELRAGTC